MSRWWKKKPEEKSIDNEERTMDNETRSYIDRLKELNGVLSEKDNQIHSIQEDYKKIFNLFADMVILIDDSGCVIDLNKRSQLMLSKHIVVEGIIGRSWKEVMENLGCTWDNSVEKKVLESDTLGEKEKEVYIDKLKKHFLISITPVRKVSTADYFILVIRDITKIKQRELNLLKKQKLLNYTNDIANIFSRNLNINYIMDKIVEILSNIDDVDLVYIYKDCENKEYAERIREYYKNSYYNDIPDFIHYSDFPRWREYFELNHIVCGTVSEFPSHEQKKLNERGAKAVCDVPIYTPIGFWGFIGFDSYFREKQWTYDEEQVLKIAANVIGGEIYKWNLRNINNNVEEIETKCVNI